LYLERWGFTVKRPSRHARDQDPDEMRQWLDETYPAIEERAESGASKNNLNALTVLRHAFCTTVIV
jgi:Winged helix-turn helix